jgi:hypothetical protein
MFSWLIVPLRIFRLLVDYLTDLVYGWIYEGDRTHGPQIPPIRDVILLDPATVLAEKIRTKKIKVRNLKVFNTCKVILSQNWCFYVLRNAYDTIASYHD